MVIRTVQEVSMLPDAKRKPTNLEFIALFADKLQLQLKSIEVANF